MVLTDELSLERGWDQGARGKIGGLEDCETVDRRERVWVEGLQKGWVRLMGVLPFVNDGG